MCVCVSAGEARGEEGSWSDQVELALCKRERPVSPGTQSQDTGSCKATGVVCLV